MAASACVSRVTEAEGTPNPRREPRIGRAGAARTRWPRTCCDSSAMKLIVQPAAGVAPGSDRLVVSPENARDVLARFLGGARRQLLIYDPKVSDDAMLRIIAERIKAGVDVRVLGRVESKWNVKCEKYPGKRLHIRAIIRDGKRAFMGSQSLRRLELEKRREVGVIITDEHVIDQMKEIFEEDWAQTESGRKQLKKEKKAEKKEEKHHLAAAS